MSPMVERVARAIFAASEIVPLNEMHFDCARAAISAMREPTEAMVEEGGETYSDDVRVGSDMAREVWTSMIDEALR